MCLHTCRHAYQYTCPVHVHRYVHVYPHTLSILHALGGLPMFMMTPKDSASAMPSLMSTPSPLSCSSRSKSGHSVGTSVNGSSSNPDRAVRVSTEAGAVVPSSVTGCRAVHSRVSCLSCSFFCCCLSRRLSCSRRALARRAFWRSGPRLALMHGCDIERISPQSIHAQRSTLGQNQRTKTIQTAEQTLRTKDLLCCAARGKKTCLPSRLPPLGAAPWPKPGLQRRLPLAFLSSRA